MRACWDDKPGGRGHRLGRFGVPPVGHKSDFIPVQGFKADPPVIAGFIQVPVCFLIEGRIIRFRLFIFPAGVFLPICGGCCGLCTAFLLPGGFFRCLGMKRFLLPAGGLSVYRGPDFLGQYRKGLRVTCTGQFHIQVDNVPVKAAPKAVQAVAVWAFWVEGQTVAVCPMPTDGAYPALFPVCLVFGRLCQSGDDLPPMSPDRLPCCVFIHALSFLPWIGHCIGPGGMVQ